MNGSALTTALAVAVLVLTSCDGAPDAVAPVRPAPALAVTTAANDFDARWLHDMEAPVVEAASTTLPRCASTWPGKRAA